MSVIDWVEDRINPVALRESRQLVRNRFALGIMMVFLFIMVVASAIYVVAMGSSVNGSFSHGKNLFNILYYILGYAVVLFLPLHTALPFLAQRQSNDMDLLFTSTIPPRSIIWGKMASAAWMAVLLFSVSMPFMMLTVLLRGIGLFEVCLFLILLMGLGLLATMGFLLLVCLPTNRMFMIVLCIGYSFFLLTFPGITATLQLQGLEAKVVGGFLFGSASMMAILGALATALVAPAVSNRALGVRITLTACWLAAGIGIWLFYTGGKEFWAVVSMIGVIIALITSSSDPSTMSRRIARSVPRNRFLRILAFPFFYGPVNGWVWCWIIGFTTLYSNQNSQDEFKALLLYGTAYTLLAVFIRRKTFVGRFCLEKYTWALVIFFGALGSILPLLANFVVNPNEDPKLLWHMGNPFAALDSDPEMHVAFAACACGILLILNLRWILRQFAAFRPVVVAATNDGDN